MRTPPGAGRFGAVVTAMVTPFDASGALDIDGAVTLARWLAGNGSDGLVVAGTTGEGPVLSDAELAELWRAVSESVTVPVIAGTGSNDTRHSVACTRLARDVGVDGALVVTPYYSRPSQAGLLAHFRAVADATDLPVLLYDIPVRTGRRIAPDTMLRLARDVPNIVGVKDASADPIGSARLIAHAPDGFE
ncbi:MAG TPA: dihydrodipicolinate synthase family protein, partial [Acidimicrobiales bacterium]|nr:dihydrodipicolinate synthase family protein [Acidimicrobiales bacterium]